jgi:WD40 repeat protein
LVWTSCHSKPLLFNSSYYGNVIICCRSATMTVLKTRYMCEQWEVGSFLDWNRLQTSLAIYTECLLCLALSPDGEAIATGSADETLRLWNVFSRSCSQKVCCITFHWGNNIYLVIFAFSKVTFV